MTAFGNLLDTFYQKPFICFVSTNNKEDRGVLENYLKVNFYVRHVLRRYIIINLDYLSALIRLTLEGLLIIYVKNVTEL